MSLRIALLAALVLLAMPAAAQTIHDTHAEVWMPSGKVPQRTFRPLSRNDCATIVRRHQAGKTMLVPDTAPPRRGCVTETAMQDRKPNP